MSQQTRFISQKSQSYLMTTSVLVPQVYVRVKPGDLDGSGALVVNADNIRNLAGTISGDSVSLNAKQDIDNIGGLIRGVSAAVAMAGRDLNLTTTTSSSAVIASEARQSSNSFAQTGIDRVAGLYVSGSAGVLLADGSKQSVLLPQV